MYLFFIGYGDATTTFEKSLYETNISANIDSNKAITKIETIDDCNDVAYAIMDGNVNNEFRINNATGEIYRNRLIDTSVNSSFVLSIAAYLRSNPYAMASFGYTYAAIAVTSTNNAPKFTYAGEVLTLYVLVNSPVDSLISVITASDSDNGADGALAFSLDETSSFFLLSSNGELTTLRTLVAQTINVTAKVSDNGNPPLSDYLILQINVMYPAADFAYRSQNISLCFYEKGNSVVTFNVSPTNFNYTYQILSGNENGDFYIIGSSLYANKTLDGDIKAVYNLSVDAINADGASSINYIVINIGVCKLSVYRPVVLKKVHTVQVAKDLQNEIVLDLEAYDTAYKIVTNVTFNLVSETPANVFSVNSSTGVIVRNSTVSNLEPWTYELNLTLCNSQHPNVCFLDVITVRITVIDQGKLDLCNQYSLFWRPYRRIMLTFIFLSIFVTIIAFEHFFSLCFTISVHLHRNIYDTYIGFEI